MYFNALESSCKWWQQILFWLQKPLMRMCEWEVKVWQNNQFACVSFFTTGFGWRLEASGRAAESNGKGSERVEPACCVWQAGSAVPQVESCSRGGRWSDSIQFRSVGKKGQTLDGLERKSIAWSLMNATAHTGSQSFCCLLAGWRIGCGFFF